MDKIVAGFPNYLKIDVENVLNIIKSKKLYHSRYKCNDILVK